MELNIVKPSVELMIPTDYEEHIAKCARICYASDKSNNSALIKRLTRDNHLSMFRHWTRYFLVPIDKIDKMLIDVETIFNLFSSEYCRFKLDEKYYYFVCNEQYYIEHYEDIKYLNNYLVSEEEFTSVSSTGKSLRRITFKVVTQISITRELNRVSPNNIAEQSTRYVNFTVKFGSICAPHWMLNEVPNNPTTIDEYDLEHLKDYDNYPLKTYINSCFNNFRDYNYLVSNNLLQPQDARDVLPLATTTVAAYTYFIDEWQNIINLRYHGTTGKPHPNAKIIAGLIRDEMNNLGYKL